MIWFIWRRSAVLVSGVVILALAAGAVGGGPPLEAGGKGEVHLPRGKNVGFNYVRTDGGNYRWDVQVYGTVAQGTKNAYGGGLYCQVNGSMVRSMTGQGWVNQAGDEIEIGPFRAGNLNVYRRVRVYKDLALARWLDILENTTPRPMTVSMRIYTHISFGIASVKSSSGAREFGAKDWAFITEPGRGRNSPSLLHVVCGKNSKLRPTVMIKGNTLHVIWQFTVPARKTAILCYFESQNNSAAAHEKLMHDFRIYDLVKDLSPGVRDMIVNFPMSFIFADIDIDRSDKADTIIDTNGDPKYGTITNKSFKLTAPYGEIVLPAEKIIGMVAVAEQPGHARALTTDGQIISGKLAEAAIDITLPSGGALHVPFERVKQWSYRISQDRPAEIEFSGPAAMLRSGDRLIFDPAATKLALRAKHGLVPLEAGAMLQVAMDNAPNGAHRAFFLNGSRLAGMLEPEKVDFSLKLGPKLSVGRVMIERLVFAREEKRNTVLTKVVLSNEDELFGKLADEMLVVATEYGPVQVKPVNLRAAVFSPTEMGKVAVQLWDGTVLRGSIQPEQLTFVIYPGPELKLHVGQIRSLIRSQALPPDDITRRVERLVAQLGAESYKDRQAAMEELVKMGPNILPLLDSSLESSDPEVRQRVEEIIERLGGEDAGPLELSPDETIFELMPR